MSTVAEFLTNLKGKNLPPYDSAVLTFPKKEPLADKILTGRYKRPGLEREREKIIITAINASISESESS